MMISSLREKVKGPVLYLIVGLIIIPFALVGLDGYANKEGAGIYVGDDFISSSAVENELKQKSRKIPGYEDLAEGEKEKFYKMIESKYVMDAMLTNYGIEVGISVSDKFISDYIRLQDYFKDENEVFNIDKYKEVLKANRLTTTKYEAIVGEQLLKEKVSTLLLLEVPKSLEISSDLLNTRIKLDVREISLSENELAVIEEPSDADINEYYNINKKSKYQTKTERGVEYVLVGKDYIGGGIEPSENDLQNRYNEYVDMESRNIKYTFANKIFNNSGEAKSYNFEENINEELIMTDTNLADVGSELAAILPSMDIKEEKYLETEYGHMKIKLISKTEPQIETMSNMEESITEDYATEMYDLELAKTIEELTSTAYEGSMKEIASQTSSDLKKINIKGIEAGFKLNEKLLKRILSAPGEEVSTVKVADGLYVYKIVKYVEPFDKNIQLPEVMSDIKISLKEVYRVMEKIKKAKNNLSGGESSRKIDISVSLFDDRTDMEEKALQKIKAMPSERYGYFELNNSVYVYSIDDVYRASEKDYKDHSADSARLQNLERTIRFKSSFIENFEYRIVE